MLTTTNNPPDTITEGTKMNQENSSMEEQFGKISGGDKQETQQAVEGGKEEFFREDHALIGGWR